MKNTQKKELEHGFLKHAEKIAIDKGAEISMLNTFDFQAE